MANNATVTITRGPSTSEGTFGTLVCTNFSCATLELPWEEDKPNVSSIPAGTYQCTYRFSPAHNKKVYHIEDIPWRTNVEIHSANVIAQLLGCIALGTEVAEFPSGTFPGIDVATKGVQHSQQAVAEFEAHMLLEPFELVIQ